MLVENDMPSLSIHGLRHSNASLLINNGFDVKAISEHLGHCNTEITVNVRNPYTNKLQVKAA